MKKLYQKVPKTLTMSVFYWIFPGYLRIFPNSIPNIKALAQIIFEISCYEVAIPPAAVRVKIIYPVNSLLKALIGLAKKINTITMSINIQLLLRFK